MSGFSNPIVGGGGSLVYPQIKSPNFSMAGQAGWAILKNGDAFFFNITAEGTITATAFIGSDFVINANGEYYYSGTPAPGNLIISVSNLSALDAKGNSTIAGVTSYFNTGSGYIAMNMNPDGFLTFWTATTEAGPWTQQGGLGLNGTNIVMQALGSNALEFSGGALFLNAVSVSGLLSALAGLGVTGTANMGGAANVSGLLSALAGLNVTGAPLNVNSGKAGNIFAVGTGSSDFAGPVFIEDQTAPATPGTSSAIYSSNGQLKYVGEDGGVYNAGAAHVFGAPAQIVNSLSSTPITGATLPVGVGTYFLEATVWGTNGAVAANQGLGINGPTASSMDVELSVDHTVGNSATPNLVNSHLTAYGRSGLISSAINGGILPAAATFAVKLRGRITFTAAGNFVLNASCVTLAADTWTVNTFEMELKPAF